MYQTHAQTHNMYKMVFKEVIAIECSGEAEQFKDLGYSNNCSALLASQDLYVCLPVHVLTYCTRTHVLRMHTHTHVLRTHSHMYSHGHTQTHTQTHTDTHRHTHTDTHRHTQTHTHSILRSLSVSWIYSNRTININ